MVVSKDFMKQIMALDAIERVKLVDFLVSSLDAPDAELDKLWAEEAESRLDAFKTGVLKAVSLDEVLAKYQ
jgi:putative addiction module component (TIGR02574 family)